MKKQRWIEDSCTGCWNWLGTLDPQGYGRDYTLGSTTVLAHRRMYERVKGSIPHGTEIDHLCRNRACVNPDHLEAVPHVVNVHRGKAAKINKEIANTIRARYAEAKISQDALAKEFGLAQSIISNIIHNNIWKDLR